MRPLPRKATIHRYPVLRHFAQTARKRSYLWSFKQRHVIRAIYAGCVLSLMPIYGLQIVIAFVVSLYIRANLMVMIALQFITNPITAVPLYILCYKVGGFIIDPLYDNPPQINIAEFIRQLLQLEGQADISDTSVGVLAQSRANNATPVQQFVYAMSAISAGGVVIGGIIAIILSIIYQWVAREAAFSYQWFQEQKRQRKEEDEKREEEKSDKETNEETK